MKTQTITRENLRLIHDAACSAWKAKLTDYANKEPFSSTVTFTDEQVTEMFDASSETQKAVLIKAGLVLPVEETGNLFTRTLEQEDVTNLRDAGLDISICNGYADVINRSDLQHKALVLYSGEVILHKTSCGSTVIEFKKKS